MLVNYISIKQTIGRFIKEFGIDETTYIEDIPQWIEDAIEIIGIPNYYTYRHKTIPVKDYRGVLPCDIDNLYGVWVSGRYVERPTMNNVFQLPIRNAQLIGGLYPTTSHNQGYGSINGGVLHTSFCEGYALFIYKGIPLDCDGYPLVPKDANLTQALSYWFIYMMSLSGFKHPVVTRGEAYQMWEKLYPKAGNSINWMDLQDMVEFTTMWNNILQGNLTDNSYIV